MTQIPQLLKRWMEFSKDVTASCYVGQEELNSLRHQTAEAIQTALHPSTEWVRVEERLPELHQKVIVGWNDGDTDFGLLVKSEIQGTVFVDVFNKWAWIDQPILWMPLPKLSPNPITNGTDKK